MKIYDNVKLIEEVEELAKKGIHKDYQGTVVKISGNDITVCFYNLYNLGEYAFATVDEKYLEFIIRADEKIILEMQEFLSNVKLEKHTTLRECDVKEYDVVELTVEKPKFELKKAIENIDKLMKSLMQQDFRVISGSATDQKLLKEFKDLFRKKDI